MGRIQERMQGRSFLRRRQLQLLGLRELRPNLLRKLRLSGGGRLLLSPSRGNANSGFICRSTLQSACSLCACMSAMPNIRIPCCHTLSHCRRSMDHSRDLPLPRSAPGWSPPGGPPRGNPPGGPGPPSRPMQRTPPGQPPRPPFGAGPRPPMRRPPPQQHDGSYHEGFEEHGGMQQQWPAVRPACQPRALCIFTIRYP